MPNTEERLRISTPDAHGETASLSLIGRRFRHSGNGRVYEVIGIAWLGDTDEWAIWHMEVGRPGYFVRSNRNFFGMRNGTLRFTEVPVEARDEPAPYGYRSLTDAGFPA